jgi:hypothetical protein
MKKLEKKVYKVYGGVYDKWAFEDDRQGYLVPMGQPIAYKLYETIITAKEKEAIARGRRYYNNNIIVIDTTTKTVVYECKNGCIITHI